MSKHKHKHKKAKLKERFEWMQDDIAILFRELQNEVDLLQQLVNGHESSSNQYSAYLTHSRTPPV